jgi:hypothetical protein
VQNALRSLFAAAPLRELVPELDWGVMHPDAAERRALEVLADALERRVLPLPASPASCASAPRACPPRRPRAQRPQDRPHLVRLQRLGRRHHRPARGRQGARRRGWDVTVFHAATRPDPSGEPYVVREWDEDGVHLVGIHNRQHGLWDLGNPLRELDDPPITQAFGALLDRVRPTSCTSTTCTTSGRALIDEAAHARPAELLLDPQLLAHLPARLSAHRRGAICGGPGDRGRDCASCVGAPHDTAGHQQRLAGIRDRFTRGVSVCLAVSDAMRSTLAGQDYPADMIDVVQQAVPAADEVWERLGRDRRPGRRGER